LIAKGQGYPKKQRKKMKKNSLPISFIVRVYRFGDDGPKGMVETVGKGEEKGFTGIEELWEILASAGRRGKRRKAKGGSHVKQV
jgi:hypothetical protein